MADDKNDDDKLNDTEEAKLAQEHDQDTGDDAQAETSDAVDAEIVADDEMTFEDEAQAPTDEITDEALADPVEEPASSSGPSFLIYAGVAAIAAVLVGYIVHTANNGESAPSLSSEGIVIEDTEKVLFPTNQQDGSADGAQASGRPEPSAQLSSAPEPSTSEPSTPEPGTELAATADAPGEDPAAPQTPAEEPAPGETQIAEASQSDQDNSGETAPDADPDQPPSDVVAEAPSSEDDAGSDNGPANNTDDEEAEVAVAEAETPSEQDAPSADTSGAEELVSALRSFADRRADEREATVSDAPADVAQAPSGEAPAEDPAAAEETSEGALIAAEATDVPAEEQARLAAEAEAALEEAQALDAEYQQTLAAEAEKAAADRVAGLRRLAEQRAQERRAAEERAREAAQAAAAAAEEASTDAGVETLAAEEAEPVTETAEAAQPAAASTETADAADVPPAPVAVIPDESIENLRREIVEDVSTIVRSVSDDVRQGVKSEVLAETEEVIDTRLAETQEAIANTERTIGSRLSETQAAIQQTEERITELQSTLSQQQQEARAQLSNLDTRIEELRMRDVAVAQRGALLVALTELGDNIDAGRPFRRQLNAVEAITGGETPLSTLRGFADDGIPTDDELREQFDVAARAALSGAKRDGADGVFDKFAANVSGLFTVRPVGDVEGNTPGAIIARAEARLEDTDALAAAEELESLEGSAAEAFADWIAAARAKGVAERGLKAVEARITDPRRG